MADFILPPGVQIIEEENRKFDGRYFIDPIVSHVFTFFMMPMGATLVMAADQFLMDRQDMSLRFWISSRPFNQADIKYNLAPRVISLRRNGTDFVLFDENMDAPTKSDRDRTRVLVPLEPNKTYFINVKNMVQQRHSYKLTFKDLAD